MPKMVFGISNWINQVVWQVRLQHLGGRYRWLRMPFGLSPAPEEFQRRIYLAHEGLLGQKAIADDILVFGSWDTDEEAFEGKDGNLRKVLNRCQQKGIILNTDKMQFRQKEVIYMRHIVSALIQTSWGRLMTCQPSQTSKVFREYLTW